jgi:cytochrome c553
MRHQSLLFFALLGAWIIGMALLPSCGGQDSSESVDDPATKKQTKIATDSSCSDVMNEPKVAPMAVAMRAMLQQAEAMRTYLISDSVQAGARPAWAPMPFERQTPTDSNVITSDFLRRAADYHKAFKLVSQEPTAEHFNALVAQCVQCHESNCPGPIKRINRLKIDI